MVFLFLREKLERKEGIFLCWRFICHCLIGWLICLLRFLNSFLWVWLLALWVFALFGSCRKIKWKERSLKFVFWWIYLWCIVFDWLLCLLGFWRCMCLLIRWSSTGFRFWGTSKLLAPSSVSANILIFLSNIFCNLSWTLTWFLFTVINMGTASSLLINVIC